MIIFLYGPDSYRLKQAKDETTQRYKSKYPSGLNLFFVDISETFSSNTLEESVKSLSFFGEHKLIVLRNIFYKKSQAENVLELINKYDLTAAKDITLLMAEDNADKELSNKHPGLFKLLSGKSSLVKNIELLQGVELKEWAEREFVVRNCTIDSATLDRLLIITGNDTWRLINEIEKLANYKNSNRITSADIDSIINRGIDMNIFSLIDAVVQKNKNNATKLLYQEIKTGQDPYYILTMIVHQFRNILMVKDLHQQGYSESEISKKSKLHPFVVKKAVNNPFNFVEATKIYGHLLLIDTGFKLGRLDLTDSLYGLVTMTA